MNKLFMPPVFEEEAKTQTARLLYVVMWTAISAATMGIVAAVVLPATATRWLPTCAIIYAVSLSIFVLTRYGYTKLASWLGTIGFWLLATVMVWTGGGIHAPSVPIYMLTVFVAGLLLGEVFGFIVAVGCLLTEFLIVYAEWNGFLPPSSFQHSAFSLWIIQVQYIAAIMGLQYLAARAVKELIQRKDVELKERRRAEEALRKSEALYTTLVTALPDVVVQTDNSGNILFINDIGLKISGYTKENLVGRNMLSLVAPEDCEKAIRNALLMFEQRMGPQEYHLINKAGEKRLFEVNGDVLRSEDGSPYGIVNVCRDITVRKQAEEALRESERKMSDIISFLPDATLVIDIEGRVLAWNRAMEELTGVKAEDILGKGDYEYAIPFYGERRPVFIDLVNAPRENVEAKYTKVQRSGEVLSGEVRVPSLRGREVYLFATAAALRDSQGNITGAIELIRDITESKRAEEALKEAKEAAESATQAKSAFLATMSHEIRTPMNAVIGMTSLLLDTPLTREQREFAETIRSSGDSLLGIINNILDFSKIEAGHMEMENRPFDLRECIEGAIDLLATGAAEKGLNLVCLMGEDVPAAIVGDVTRLRQILVNLLSNAVKFTEHGDVELGVHIVPERSALPPTADTPSQPVTLRFSVKDSGIGIPRELMDRLFQSFSQVDASTTRRYGGTGLGLVISKRLVELMKGTMWVESEVGRGSTFFFTIQAVETSLPKHDYLQRIRAVLREKRVLVVDDKATNQRILILQTQGWGMLPRATGSASEALEWIRRGEPFDVAILDIQMPEMDGMTLAAEIRKIRDAHTLPLIMLSSMGQRDPEADKSLYNAFLTKPIKASQLYNVLAGLFGSEVDISEKELPRFDARMAEKHPLRILLAEDNAVNQKLALKLLGRFGYRADLAANGLEAIDALRRQHYDVILMDIQMPEMDGLEASRAICREWPPERRPCIIAMTANVMQEDREACIAAGMDGFIGKPIRVEELTEALTKCKLPEGNKSQPSQGAAEVFTAGAPPPLMPADSPPSLLDPVALKRLREMAGGDHAFITEMVDTFLADAPGMFVELDKALAGGDAATFRRVAHSLKSNSRDFGAMDLSEISRQMEMMGKEGVLAGAAEKLSLAKAAYERLGEPLKALRQA